MKPTPLVMDKWAGVNLTQRPKGPSLSPGLGNLINKDVITQKQNSIEKFQSITDLVTVVIVLVVTSERHESTETDGE